MIYTFIYLFTFFQAHKLAIEIEAIPNSKGDIYIAVYNDKSKFPSMKGFYTQKIIPASSANYTFHDLPAGDYAVAIFHDQNKNGKLDKNIVGYPTEAFGFSNQAKAIFSAPSFEEAKIKLNSDRKITIKID